MEHAIKIAYRCPISGGPLRQKDAVRLVCTECDAIYPIRDGIPILLPSVSERMRVLETDWDAAETIGTDPIDFYNQTRDHDLYCRDQLDWARLSLEKWVGQLRSGGPVLEIGSGKRALQGIGGDYVALDYSFTALLRYIDGRYRRVCASAESLPFIDNAFRFIFTVATLEHVANPDRALAEIDRVLQPGGVAYLAPAWHCNQYNCDGIPVRP
jgi:SAM-dependent methyltransferase